MAISEGEYIELAQYSPKMVRDGRTGGLAKDWITDGLHKRWVQDPAEKQELQQLFGMTTGTLPVISWTILSRIPEITA